MLSIWNTIHGAQHTCREELNSDHHNEGLIAKTPLPQLNTCHQPFTNIVLFARIPTASLLLRHQLDLIRLDQLLEQWSSLL